MSGHDRWIGEQPLGLEPTNARRSDYVLDGSPEAIALLRGDHESPDGGGLSEAERSAVCICPATTWQIAPGDTHELACSMHKAAVERSIAARVQTAEAERDYALEDAADQRRRAVAAEVRADDLRTALAEQRAKVLALAYEWQKNAGTDRDTESRTLRDVAAYLRAALDDSPAVRIMERGLAEMRADLTADRHDAVVAAKALRDAADEADEHARHCPEGCDTARCRAGNRITATWLRARAAALIPADLTDNPG